MSIWLRVPFTADYVSKSRWGLNVHLQRNGKYVYRYTGHWVLNDHLVSFRIFYLIPTPQTNRDLTRYWLCFFLLLSSLCTIHILRRVSLLYTPVTKGRNRRPFIHGKEVEPMTYPLNLSLPSHKHWTPWGRYKPCPLHTPTLEKHIFYTLGKMGSRRKS